jgi:hypothetical protein
MATYALDTAGERLSISCSLPWVADLIAEGAAAELRRTETAEGSVQVEIEADRRPFDTSGWEPLTRGAWRRNGDVVVENACTAGFDLHLSCSREKATFTYRWRPPARDRAAARILRSRFHLLARAVLTQYPALWWAATRGRAPLHASACTVGAFTPLLTAASGIGRSTITLQALDAGGLATGDNLGVGDGVTVWGLVEPLRVEGGNGRRMPHGRSEADMPRRVEALMPDCLVCLERWSSSPGLRAITPEVAARSVITSTYMAGELRRYWAFAATLSAGTALGPCHPAVTEVAHQFARRLRCFTLAFDSTVATPLSELPSTVEEVAV